MPAFGLWQDGRPTIVMDPYGHSTVKLEDDGRRLEAEGIHVGKAAALDAFCGPEEGAVDYEAVRDVLQEVDYSGFAIVEQDMFPAPFDKPLPIAQRSVAYLKKIGLA